MLWNLSGLPQWIRIVHPKCTGTFADAARSKLQQFLLFQSAVLRSSLMMLMSNEFRHSVSKAITCVDELKIKKFGFKNTKPDPIDAINNVLCMKRMKGTDARTSTFTV